MPPRQREPRPQPMHCTERSPRGVDFPRRQYLRRILRMVVHDRTCHCKVMAHNFQGHISYCILQYLREQGVKYNVIMRSANVLSSQVDMFNIRFIDLLNVIPMKLANFPKTFGIEELSKGHFRHLFNRKENKDYVGTIAVLQS